MYIKRVLILNSYNLTLCTDSYLVLKQNNKSAWGIALPGKNMNGMKRAMRDMKPASPNTMKVGEVRRLKSNMRVMTLVMEVGQHLQRRPSSSSSIISLMGGSCVTDWWYFSTDSWWKNSFLQSVMPYNEYCNAVFNRF